MVTVLCFSIAAASATKTFLTPRMASPIALIARSDSRVASFILLICCVISLIAFRSPRPRLHFRCHHGKAVAGLARSRGLDRRIDAEGGPAGDPADQVGDGSDLAAASESLPIVAGLGRGPTRLPG